MDPTGTFKLVPPVDIPFPLLLELFSAAPVTFPGNNLLLCFGEAQPLFLHSVLLMRAQGTRRESSRKWEGASGAWLKLPRSFDVPWGRGLLSPPIPLANPAWHQLTLAVPRWQLLLQQRAFGKGAGKAAVVPCSSLPNERQLSAGVV